MQKKVNQNIVAKTSNNYFLSVADSFNSDNNKYVNMANPINFLPNNFIKSFTKTNRHYATTNEIEKNYKILKIKKYVCV
jgi:hypothetical protein